MTRNLLIVEDDPVLAKYLSRLFERRGYQVDTVGSVAAFVASALRLRYHAFLVDLCLPDGDGLQGWEAARAAQAGAVAVLMTAHGNGAVVERAERLGVRGPLPKPLDLTALVSAVEGTDSNLGRESDS